MLTVLADIFAPWIWDSYRDAYARLPIDLPRLTTDFFVQTSVVAATLFASFVVLWFAVSGLPLRARIVARLFGAVPLLSPLPLLVGLTLAHLEALSEHPTPAEIGSRSLRVPADPPDVPHHAATARGRNAGTSAASVPKSAASEAASVTTPGQPPAAPGEVRPPASVTPSVPSKNPLTELFAGRSDIPSRLGGVPPVSEPAKPEAVVSAPPSTVALPRVAAVAPPPRVATPPSGRSDRRATVLFATNRPPSTDGGGSPGVHTGVDPARLRIGRALLGDPRRGQTIIEVAETGEQDFAGNMMRQMASANRHQGEVLVLLHGHETGFEDALRQGAWFAERVGFDGPVVVFSWPSSNDPRRYAVDAASAEAAIPHFAAVLRLLVGSTTANAVHVAAVGLGARTAFGAIHSLASSTAAELRRGDGNGGSRLGHLLLIAPDMDRAALAAISAAVRPTVSGITLYASANDRALNVTRRHAGAVPRAGDVSDGGPFVTPAVVTVDVSPAGGEAASGTDIVSARETTGETGAGAALLAHARAMLGGIGMSGGDQAVGGLKRIDTPSGAYWARR